MDAHVSSVLQDCASSLYALNKLRAHGLQAKDLKEVFRAKILSKILYGSPAWWGYCSVNTCNRIESFLKKSKKFGLYDSDADLFETLCQIADEKLFNKIRRDCGHVLHRFLSESRAISYNLRPRRHDYILPIKDNQYFFNRVLFKDIV